MFDLMAGGAEGGQAEQRLDMLFVVIMPEFVALDRPLRAAPATDLTPIARVMRRGFAERDPTAAGLTSERTLENQQVCGTSSIVRYLSLGFFFLFFGFCFIHLRLI